MLSITALQHWGCCIVSLPFRDMIIEQSNSSIFSNNDLTHISLHTSNSYVVRTQYKYYNDSLWAADTPRSLSTVTINNNPLAALTYNYI